MSAARYFGYRTEAGVRVLKEAKTVGLPLPVPETISGITRPPGLMGYGGSGPAQLALAILTDAVGEKKGAVHYQDFKFAVISGLSHDKVGTEPRRRSGVVRTGNSRVSRGVATRTIMSDRRGKPRAGAQ